MNISPTGQHTADEFPNCSTCRYRYDACREECNALDSCVFIGRSITGACAARDPSILHEVCIPLPTDSWNLPET